MWTIIYYYHNAPMHLEALRKSNSKNQIIPIKIEHNLPDVEAWRNVDRTIRKYLNTIINDILYDNILLVEWDVYIDTEVPDIDFDGALFNNIIKNKNNGWYWWKEIDSLPEEFRSCATGGALWSLIAIKKTYLELLLSNKYDYLYEMDIFSELRTPTLMQHLGMPLSELPRNWSKFMSSNESILIKQILDNKLDISNNIGIFHPVKKHIF